MVLRNLELFSALRDLPSRQIVLSPNLVEEEVIADALKNELGCSRGCDAPIGVGKGVAGHGFRSGHGFQNPLASRVGAVDDDKVKGDVSLYVALLRLSSRSHQENNQSKEDTTVAI